MVSLNPGACVEPQRTPCNMTATCGSHAVSVFFPFFFIGNSLTASCPSLGLKHIFALSDEEVCER
jgi:hypothetical protein